MQKVQVGIQTRRERRRRRGRGCCRECKTRWQVGLSDPDPTFDENNQTRRGIQKFKKLPIGYSNRNVPCWIMSMFPREMGEKH